MILSDISVKRPVFATVISALLVAFGLFALRSLPLREAPDIDAPIISIRTDYPGASADIVESKVTRVIEDEISGVEGIRTIESDSSDGRSRITIEFKIERNIDAAANDVRDRVSRVLDRLPEEVEAPDISKADADTQPIMWLTLDSSKLSSLEIFDYAERYIVDRLSAIDGVSRVRLGGEQRYAMRIWLDRRAMAARGITVADVEAALRRENVERPAGQLESETRDFTVRTSREYQTVDDFKRLVIMRGADGYLVRLAEIADVYLGAENEKREFRSNSRAAAGLGIIKQSQANTLTVARAVRAEVDKVRKTLPEGTNIMVNTDYSIFIEASLHEVGKTLLITAVLVIFVIFLFLGDIRSTLVPGVTVPISLIGSFIALAAFGFSINILTLLALVLAIGLVVDDAIVMLENIYRRIEHGETPLLAAYRGARQVGFAIVATTLVLVAVLAPIALVPGSVGRLFTEFSLALAAAVFVSALVALTLCPVLCSKLLKPNAEKTRVGRAVDRITNRLKNRYRRSLYWCLEHRDVVVILAVLITALIAILLPRVPNEFAPKEDRGAVMIFVRGPEGASFEYTRARMRELEAELRKYNESGVSERMLAISPTGEANSGFGFLSLADWSKRDVTAEQLAREIFVKMQKYPGARFIAAPRPGLGQSRSRQPLQIVIGASTYEELTQLRDKMIAKLEENPRIFGLDSDYQETKPQMRVNIDRDRAADLGISIDTIGRTLETMLGSRKITTFVDRGEEYDVMVQAKRSDRRTPTDLTNIYVRSDRSGALVPLSNLVTLKEVGGATSLPRFNRLRAITISGNLAPDYTLGDAVDYVEKVAADVLTTGAQLDFKGEARDMADSSNALMMAFGLSLLVVYLVLAAQFESFIHPMVIMLTVPLAIAAALFGLWVMGMSLNIYSKIGIIMLIGLAAKNGILIVEFANQLRDKGMTFREALVSASVERMRPILMTGLSTVMGAVPLMLATGAGAEARSVLGVVVFAGVAFSGVLTLYVVPVFYDLFAKHSASPDAVAQEIRVLDEKYPRLIEKKEPGLEPGE